MSTDTMSTDKMLSRKDGPIGLLTFNNPERRNAVSPEMSLAGAEILEDFAADKAIRVVVLHGAGDKAFVSGADISKFESARATPEQAEKWNKASETFRDLLRQYRQADHRHDPRLLRRRRPGHRSQLRPAHHRGGRAVRHPGRQVGHRLCRRCGRAARRSRRPLRREGYPVHRAAHERAGGAAARHRQLCRRAGRARGHSWHRTRKP